MPPDGAGAAQGSLFLDAYDGYGKEGEVGSGGLTVRFAFTSISRRVSSESSMPCMPGDRL